MRLMACARVVGNFAAIRFHEKERRYPTDVSLLDAISCFIFLIFALFLAPQAWVAGLIGLGIGAYFLLIKWKKNARAPLKSGSSFLGSQLIKHEFSQLTPLSHST